MKMNLSLVGVLSCVFLASCGGYDNSCTINAAITPATTTADHNASAPGNQAQFSIKSTVTGNCPLVPDKIGTWSTSDTVIVTISNQVPTQGLASCLNATSSSVTITNDGNIRGHAITSATLTCN
jgi:hypothetical protein